ncbi:cytochrome P-450 like protein [Rivularia sp. IAM M-261]|nr:cytochrome P-450 like protein [Rivularia sp. IAM M-261]
MQAPNILSAEFEKSPYQLYENIRENYPLFFHEATNSYVVSRYEDVERAFKDPAFSSRHAEAQFEPVYGRTMVQMDGREHATNRNLVIQALGSYKLNEKFLPLIKENARELLSKFSSRGEVELVEEFTSIYPLNVIRTILGLPKQDMPFLKKWCIDISNFLSNLSQNPEVTAAGLQSSKEFQAYLAPIIKRKQQNSEDDLLSSLCIAEIDGIKLTDDEITSLAMLLFGAGGETTDKALALMFRNLIVHREQLQQVLADRSLVERAFTETLRYSPPIQWLMRLTLEDVKMTGGTIPANSMVIGLIAAANRDPRKYSEPDNFNIFRQDLDVYRAFSGAANHLAFGGGKHFCIGTKLAREEVIIATNFLLDSMQNMQFVNGELPEEYGFFARGLKKLSIKFSSVRGDSFID